jgi:hypothetical protein
MSLMVSPGLGKRAAAGFDGSEISGDRPLAAVATIRARGLSMIEGVCPVPMVTLVALPTSLDTDRTSGRSVGAPAVGEGVALILGDERPEIPQLAGHDNRDSFAGGLSRSPGRRDGQAIYGRASHVCPRTSRSRPSLHGPHHIP